MSVENAGFFGEVGDKQALEAGMVLSPKFDEHGLIPAIATDYESGEVLMFAWMNAEALRLTIEKRAAHFYSRSRKKLWMKGEESGNVLAVRELRTDCDQDCVWMRVTVGGHGGTCHTGFRSCFYRSVELGEGFENPREMRQGDTERVFDPADVYKK